MVPFNVKTGMKDEYGQDIYIKKAQFQLGYKGYIQLAIRSGYYKKINVLAIKEGELVKYDPLAEEIEVKLIEDDEIRENTPTIGYYAMFEYANGFRKTLYWSKKKMLTHADKYSMAFNKEIYEKIQDGKISQKDMWKYSSFWYKDFDGMAFKTMLRQLISKWGIMSIELQEAYDKDMATINENGTYDYIENDDIVIPTSTVENKENKDSEANNNEISTEAKTKMKNEAKVKYKKEEDNIAKNEPTIGNLNENQASNIEPIPTIDDVKQEEFEEPSINTKSQKTPDGLIDDFFD